MMTLSAAEIKDIQTKCVVLMMKYAPDKVGNIQKALDTAYKGREADLLTNLTQKYDPPPEWLRPAEAPSPLHVPWGKSEPVKKSPPQMSTITLKLMNVLRVSNLMKPTPKKLPWTLLRRLWE